MKFKEVGFRAVYHNFCLIEFNRSLEKFIRKYPNTEHANGVLAYGYYDSITGLTFEILAAAIIEPDGYYYNEGFPDTYLKVRIADLGDTDFYVISDEDGKISERFADKLDMVKHYDSKKSYLKNIHQILNDAVERFKTIKTESNLLDVLEILRDCHVWIPCTAIMSGVDGDMIKKMVEDAGDDIKSLEGMEFTTKDQVRLIPDILQNGDAFFFPIFSTAEEMGDYGRNFSKVEKHVLEAISLARNNDKNLAGIVLDAFSNPFVIDAKLFDLVESMKSRIEKS